MNTASVATLVRTMIRCGSDVNRHEVCVAEGVVGESPLFLFSVLLVFLI